jgi:hypothetical protein
MIERIDELVECVMTKIVINEKKSKFKKILIDRDFKSIKLIFQL